MMVGMMVACDGSEIEAILDALEADQPVSYEVNSEEYDETLLFPTERYPETGAHIRDAIVDGHSDVCTIDRDGADGRREESLAGVPTKPGYDRDEWPMAACAEGGEGASVRHIDPSDNRGAGSWVGNQISDYPDGTKVKFIVE
ncbi:NucA/NucB deoxyribonuclease domain-containing protein [Desmospora activa]